LTLVVTVASWILYVANEFPHSVIFQQKLLYFAFLNKLSAEIFLCITRLENVLQVLALVPPRLAPLLHKPCLHLQNSLVIQITISALRKEYNEGHGILGSLL
jgi:hypothetical protein